MTDRINEIRARLEGVTEGPWFVQGVRMKVEGQSAHSVSRYDEEKKRDEQICAVWYDPKTHIGFADAQFIAATRTDVPYLLAEIDRLTADLAAKDAEIERLRKAIRDIDRHNDDPRLFNGEIHAVVQSIKGAS